jgi:hypothetical protein
MPEIGIAGGVIGRDQSLMTEKLEYPRVARPKRASPLEGAGASITSGSSATSSRTSGQDSGAAPEVINLSPGRWMYQPP